MNEGKIEKVVEGDLCCATDKEYCNGEMCLYWDKKGKCCRITYKVVKGRQHEYKFFKPQEPSRSGWTA